MFRVQEHGGENMIPFSCVLERNLADMPPDEATKYCMEKELQRSVQYGASYGEIALVYESAILMVIDGSWIVKLT